MKKFYTVIMYVIILTAAINAIKAQCIEWNSIQVTDSIFTNPAFGNATSPEIDKLGRPYTYLATVSGGVKIYNNNSSGSPTLTATVPKTSLGNLDAINLYQDSIWLYVCLGNIWNSTEMAGLAIIDVSNPATPNVLDVYSHTGKGGGAGSVVINGNYAYLAANQNGLVILNITNKSNIQLTSELLLSNNFPHSTIGSESMYNARGIALHGNYAFVCYDRGGLRVIDISNVSLPSQISQYCYSPLINKTTAYNNITINKNLAYVSIDYYGMEILDISNPHNIVQTGWWHPDSWADTTNNFNTWANSKGHANELAYDTICKKVYLAAGKSDLVAIDVNNPAIPVTCQLYGSDVDSYGSWGLDFFNNDISIAYIWSIAAPPYSNYTGFKLLQTNCKATNLSENKNDLRLSPNPTSALIKIDLNEQKLRSVKILGLNGELLQEHYTSEFSIEKLTNGMYIVQVQTDKSVYVNKIIKE